jgi:MFS transporter, DHA2 family, glioxin efflux transporter
LNHHWVLGIQFAMESKADSNTPTEFNPPDDSKAMQESSEPPSLAKKPSDVEDSEPIVYPSNSKLLLILSATALIIFLVALDTTIVSTAIPRITDDFHSLDDVAWYGSGFFMTMAAFQSLWGKGYKYFNIKLVFLLSIVIFEVGSMICGAAPNSEALLIGRAIAGVGGAGVASGSYLIVGISAPPEKTPALLGFTGASFAFASVAGPLIGGAFTSNATWRWCFYINLPIGAVSFLVIVFLFHNPAHVRPIDVPISEKLLQMDIPGTLLLLCAVICLMLGLQWGGVTKPWSDSDVIGTLVGAGLIAIALVAWEWFQGERAAVNPRLLKMKTVRFMMIFQVLVTGGFFVLLYYLPIYFQVSFLTYLSKRTNERYANF